MLKPKEKSIDEKIQESKKRSRELVDETLDLADIAPDETVNGLLSDVDNHLKKTQKKCDDLRNGHLQ